MNRTVIAIALAAAAAAAQAQPAPLSPEALRRCADQVIRLRGESARLTRLNAQLDARRAAINQRSAALDAEAAAIDQNDLKKSLELSERRKRHNAETLRFNGEVEQIRRDIAALNAVKLDYDRGCSNRPYRRADLEALPEAQRTAMRQGMADVVVPYIDN